MSPPVGPISPFFIVQDLAASLQFYQTIGFGVLHAEPVTEPFFAIVGGAGARLFLKEVSADVSPQPNHTLHEWVPWDAFVFVHEPDTLVREFSAGGVAFRQPLGDRDDGLRGFEVEDPDGHVLFFGRPAAEGRPGE